jgi:two-component system chemotaxis response regulator CheY
MGYTKTVVVVDDADMVRTMLGFILENAGYTTLSGVDGRDALAFFDGREVDLVITDLNMPNMDGVELIAKIRSKESYQYIPIVLFIADDAADRDSFRETGATAIFDKKDIQEKLLPTIKKLVG